MIYRIARRPGRELRLAVVAALQRAPLISLLGALAVSGCYNTRSGDVEYAPADFGQPDPMQDVAVNLPELRIRPLDTIEVQVFGVEQLSGTFTVGIRGDVDLPLLGPVPASGLTAEQLSDRVEARYRDGYVRDPQVFINLDRELANTVTMDGSWSSNGVYPWRPRMTLMQASAIAGGTRQGAIPKRTFIFRTIDGERRVAAFDLSDIRRGKMQDPAIYPDDIIVVDGSETRDAVRDVLTALPIVALFSRF